MKFAVEHSPSFLNLVVRDMTSGTRIIRSSMRAASPPLDRVTPVTDICWATAGRITLQWAKSRVSENEVLRFSTAATFRNSRLN